MMLGGMVGIGFYLTTEILEHLGILFAASAFVTTLVPFLAIMLATGIIWSVYFS